MDFASAYLAKRAIFPDFIKESPESDTRLIVVIPAYNEPEVTRVLDSLEGCEKPSCATEVIIVVNSPSEAAEEIRANNRLTIDNIECWKSVHPDCFFKLFIIDVTSCNIPGWGVGLARKTGMDEAVRRFSSIGRSDGFIVCLDADCTVEKNYFTSIYREMCDRKDRSACSIYFEHPLSGIEFPDEFYRAIVLYELHLRYYLQGLIYTGFPFSHQTIGSAMAVRADIYVKAGGMNRRQAGEDFYFIQKLVPMGGYFNLNSTTVYPSPRSSFRVPFGTGATMTKLTGDKCDQFLSYNIQAFKDLKSFFVTAGIISENRNSEAGNYYDGFPETIRLFLTKQDWVDKMLEIRKNTTGPVSFMKRFFTWFNMFMIVKFMNTVHRGILKKEDVTISAAELLAITGNGFCKENAAGLLVRYRTLEKKA